MKILQVINSLHSGGAEKLIVDSIIKYNQQGVPVNLLLLNGRNTPFMNYLRSNIDLKVNYLSMSNFIYNPLHILKIIKYLKKYDIVHVHLFPSLYMVSLAHLISRAKCKLIFTEHNYACRVLNACYSPNIR